MKNEIPIGCNPFSSVIKHIGERRATSGASKMWDTLIKYGGTYDPLAAAHTVLQVVRGAQVGAPMLDDPVPKIIEKHGGHPTLTLVDMASAIGPNEKRSAPTWNHLAGIMSDEDAANMGRMSADYLIAGDHAIDEYEKRRHSIQQPESDFRSDPLSTIFRRSEPSAVQHWQSKHRLVFPKPLMQATGAVDEINDSSLTQSFMMGVARSVCGDITCTSSANRHLLDDRDILLLENVGRAYATNGTRPDEDTFLEIRAIEARTKGYLPYQPSTTPVVNGSVFPS